MLKHILAFEIRYWLRSWMLWIFLLIVGALVFGAASTDNITLGEALSNTFRNSPYNVQNYYSFIGLFTMIMAAAFVNSAAARDFTFNTYQIVFSTPLKRWDFLMGRFLGAALVSMIPMLGVSLGFLLAKYMPWVEPERWGRLRRPNLAGSGGAVFPRAWPALCWLLSISVPESGSKRSYRKPLRHLPFDKL